MVHLYIVFGLFLHIGQRLDELSFPCEIKAFILFCDISNMIYLQICEPLYIDRFFRRVRLFQNQQKRQHQQRTAKRGDHVFQPCLWTVLFGNNGFDRNGFRLIGSGLHSRLLCVFRVQKPVDGHAIKLSQRKKFFRGRLRLSRLP